MAAFHQVSDFSHVKPLLLDMAQERDAERLLSLVTERLAAVHNIALARVWLVGEDGGLRVVAAARDPQDGETLSAERPPAGLGLDPGSALGSDPQLAAWCGGDFVLDLGADPGRWAWARMGGFGGLCAQPMLCRGAFLGVLEVFTYTRVPEEGPSWLRLITDHAAAALAGGRALAEVELLRSRLEEENQSLKEELRELSSFGAILGESPALKRVLSQIDLVAPTDATVLIQGESGTGKELIARELHLRSARADAPLVRVNCASIPSELYESEFFGHVRGAFTGAVSDRAGRFELANGGTLFLDEIGELPLEMQAKLLRVLQEGEYERVGDDRTRQVNVRIVAATNRDMAAEVSAGRLRQDLYYRLEVFPIRVPPLRERAGDVRLLAEHFAHRAAERLGRPRPRMTARAWSRLAAYSWPGNVRELENAIERALILAPDGVLEFDLSVAEAPVLQGAESSWSPAPRAADGERIWNEGELRAFEAANLQRALHRAGGRISGPGGAAELLGMNPNTLASRVRRMGQSALSA